MSGDIGVEVPSFFLCPIALEIMKDPVTACTGITYDRDSIEKWIFSKRRGGEVVCPVTKQPISGDELIPNHTLRRLIQAWCVANAANGVERLPTPRAPLDKAQICQIMEDAKRPETQIDALRKLRSLAGESERNRRCIEEAGAAEFLISLVRRSPNLLAEEEALGALHSLQIPPRGFVELITKNEDLVEILVGVLKRSNFQSRAHATFILYCLFEAASPARFLSLKEEFFAEMVRVLRDRISYKATKVALRVLAQACPWGRNRIKATEAGAVTVIVELLLEDVEKRACEMALVVLDQLCCCAEGRSELLKHSAGLAVVSKKILRVSPFATERAVRVIGSVAKSSGTPAVLQEMLQVGVVAKLCLLLTQEDSRSKTKEKAMAILRLHSQTWRKSPCIPHHLLASYPSR